MVTELKDTIRRTDEGIINYQSRNRIEYKRQPDGYHIFDYFLNGRMIRLNDLVPPSWKLVPVDSNFKILIREGWNALPSPEIHLSIPGLRFPGLGEDELSILAALHEIGHANLEHKLLELLRENALDGLTEGEISLRVFRRKSMGARDNYPNIPRLKGEYSEQLVSSCNFFSQWYNYERFSERYAWYYAFNTTRKLGILEQFDIIDFRHFYVPCLAAYNEVYVSKTHRENYSHRWESDPFPWITRQEKRSWIKKNN